MKTRSSMKFNGVKVKDDDISLVHCEDHMSLMKKASSKAYDSKRQSIADSFDSVYLNEGSTESAYVAAGCVVEASRLVLLGKLSSAVAVVRPPGHHAEPDRAMRFCIFNNVSIAASSLLRLRPKLKILIVDWDVHHGNGTQKMFEEDNRVLYFSIHRIDLFPETDDGLCDKIGVGAGAGYNVNVPLKGVKYGDADFISVWDQLLIPIAQKFAPEII